jgi:PilZ domain-containing protein
MAGALIEQLKHALGLEDKYLSKRSIPRTSFDSAIMLEMRVKPGATLFVTAVNVSDNGLGFMTREALKDGDEIELRMADEDPGEFEPFEVRRVTQTVGGFKVGVVSLEP